MKKNAGTPYCSLVYQCAALLYAVHAVDRRQSWTPMTLRWERARQRSDPHIWLFMHDGVLQGLLTLSPYMLAGRYITLSALLG